MIIYKHLRYLWAVATEGGVARACEGPNLTPQTVSAQLCLLEDYLGTCAFCISDRLETNDIPR